MINFRSAHAGWVSAQCNFGGVETTKTAIGFISSLWEGKCDLGNLHEGLGGMIDYVKCYMLDEAHISFILHDKFGSARKGVIMDLVVDFDDGHSAKIMPWSSQGSKAVLESLLTRSRISPEMKLLEKVEDACGVRWKSEEGMSPYLGSPAFGDVYNNLVYFRIIFFILIFKHFPVSNTLEIPP